MIPGSVRIGCSEWTILRRSLRASNGLCESDKRQIIIDPDLADDEAEETFLHEVLHACMTFAGVLDNEEKLTEEEFVRRLSPILHAVLRQNYCWS